MTKPSLRVVSDGQTPAKKPLAKKAVKRQPAKKQQAKKSAPTKKVPVKKAAIEKQAAESAPVEREVNQPSGYKITPALEGSARDVLAAMRQALAMKLDMGEIAPNSIASTYRELCELDRMIREIDAEAAEKEAADDDDSDRRAFKLEAI